MKEEYLNKKKENIEKLKEKFFDRNFIFDEYEELVEFEEEKNRSNELLEKKKEVSKRLYEIATDSALHGIPLIARSKSLERGFWHLVFWGCIAYSIYLCVLTIITFMSHQTTTKIRYVNELPGLFPTVMVCNTNPFSTNFSIEFVKQIMENNSLVEAGTQPFDLTNLAAEKLQTILYLTRAYAKSDYFSKSDKMKLGFSLNEFILGCKMNFYPCDMRDWTWYYDFEYGNCYIYNSGVNITGVEIPWVKTIKADKVDALIVEAYVGNKDLQSLFPNRGIIVKVFNITTDPSIVVGYNAITGFETSMVFNRAHREFLPYPYNECQIDTYADTPTPFDSILYNLIIASNFSYTQKSCFNQCYQKMLIESCSCYDVSYTTLFSDVRPCLTLNEYNCLKIIYENFMNSNPNVICGNDCPLECNTIQFKMDKASLSFPSQSYADYFVKNNPNVQNLFPDLDVTYETIRDNFARTAVYYQKNIYQHITDYPTNNLPDSIASMGGNIGLFTGASTASIGELLEAIIEWSIGWYSTVVQRVGFYQSIVA